MHLDNLGFLLCSSNESSGLRALHKLCSVHPSTGSTWSCWWKLEVWQGWSLGYKMAFWFIHLRQGMTGSADTKARALTGNCNIHTKYPWGEWKPTAGGREEVELRESVVMSLSAFQVKSVREFWAVSSSAEECSLCCLLLRRKSVPGWLSRGISIGEALQECCEDIPTKLQLDPLVWQIKCMFRWLSQLISVQSSGWHMKIAFSSPVTSQWLSSHSHSGVVANHRSGLCPWKVSHRLCHHYNAFILPDLHNLSNVQVVQINFLKLTPLEINGSVISFHISLASIMLLLVFKAMGEENNVGAVKCKFTCVCG